MRCVTRLTWRARGLPRSRPCVWCIWPHRPATARQARQRARLIYTRSGPRTASLDSRCEREAEHAAASHALGLDSSRDGGKRALPQEAHPRPLAPLSQLPPRSPLCTSRPSLCMRGRGEPREHACCRLLPRRCRPPPSLHTREMGALLLLLPLRCRRRYRRRRRRRCCCRRWRRCRRWHRCRRCNRAAQARCKLREPPPRRRCGSDRPRRPAAPCTTRE